MSRMDDTVETVQSLGRDIGAYIREQRSSAQISLRELARLAGVSNPYLSQIERGVRHPSASVLAQIAKGLRISAEALYVQAGILEERAGGPVVDAVAADPVLSERQKQVLLEIYQSFLREAGTTARPTVPGPPGPSAAVHEPDVQDSQRDRATPSPDKE